MKIARRSLAVVLAIMCLGGVFYAQSPSGTEAETVIELKALVFALQVKLVAVEKELGQEKVRRAELEQAELQRAKETLEPNVKKKLGLPVSDTKVPAEKVPPKD